MPYLGPSLEDLTGGGQTDDEGSATQALKSKLTEIQIKQKEEEIERMAKKADLPYINLVGFAISPETITTLDQEKANQLKAICFFNNGREIRLGTTNYNDNIKELEKKLAEKFHAHVSAYLISENSLRTALKLYAALPKTRQFIAGIEIKEVDLKKFEKDIKSFRDLNAIIQKTSLTEMVNLLIAGAIKSRASDIHIEAEEKGVNIRYRIDGVLNDVAGLNQETWPKIASRLKQIAKLKINITDRPQDGRFSIYLTNDRVDVRVSTLPTAFGESIVMRLLMSSATALSFSDLGLRGQAFEFLAREIKRPNGMIVTTGPTGSGKTTTLYAILKKLNQPDTKIITIEDPIEYELKGISQSQVNKDYTFAKGLKSIVRQDPDVVMVGEIRDLETAEIAIQAALTGHLVLSTIHTNDAFGTIPRLLSMGTKPFLLAPALNVAIGQRLVRKICEKCRQEIKIDDQDLARVKEILASLPPPAKEKINLENLKFYQGQGCEQCQNLGYKGRIGIYEVMPITGKMEKTITQGNLSENDIKQMATEQGVVTMVQDGVLKALEGITSIAEVFRVAE